MVLGRKAATYQDLPRDTKAYNQQHRTPNWGKNDATPYWERHRKPSWQTDHLYNEDWSKTESYNENEPGLAREHRPQYDPNGRNVMEMPGNVASMDTQGVGEGLHIWLRMAVIVRFRRIDLIELMHARDPKDCNMFEQTQFQRALADVFGPSWTELAMTNDEFDLITEPYKCRRPTGPGQPPAMIQYRNFCVDLQKFADEDMSDAHIGAAFAMRHQQPPRAVRSLR